jgi:integral membrane sensor domain MASE1
MEWIAVTVLFVYLAIGLPYAIYINKDWFKKAKNNKYEVDETMLCIGTTFIFLAWPLFFIVRTIKNILK